MKCSPSIGPRSLKALNCFALERLRRLQAIQSSFSKERCRVMMPRLQLCCRRNRLLGRVAQEPLAC